VRAPGRGHDDLDHERQHVLIALVYEVSGRHAHELIASRWPLAKRLDPPESSRDPLTPDERDFLAGLGFDNFNTLPLPLDSQGQGVVSIMSIYRALKSQGPGPYWILHPESNLHPSVQGNLFDWLCSLRRVLIVETHSELFLLRLLRHIRYGNLSRSDVEVYFISGSGFEVPSSAIDVMARSIDGLPDYARPKIEDDGEVSDWVYSFFRDMREIF